MDRDRQRIGDERDHGGTKGTATNRNESYTRVVDLRSYPEPNRPSIQYLLVWAFVVLAVAALLVWYRSVGELSQGNPGDLVRNLINEGLSVIGAGTLFFPVRALARSRPMTQGRILSRLPLYAVALIAFSLLHTSWNWATRAILFPIAGLGEYHYGAMPLPYLMEFPVDVLIFTLMVVAIHISHRLELGRRRQLDAAQLEANLARAELDNLRLRLQPHFLFNALNTVSAVMYEDPRRADEVLDRLGELLRASLEQDRIDEVSLAEELGILDAYLAITRARFGDRLIVEVAVPVELQSARVPPLLLQPLVENAVRHGRSERDGHGRIRVSARSDGGRLFLEVWDDGDGSLTGVGGSGLGLEATRERLRLLHGEDAAMAAGPAEDGGFAVTLQLPLRFIEEGA